MGIKRHTIETVHQMALSKGVILISKEYKNSKTHLIFECNIHGRFSTSLGSFKKTHGCPSCGYILGGKKQTLSLEKVKDFYVQRGYEPLFDNYQRAKEKLPCRCPIHGVFSISYDNLKHGKGCRSCYLEKSKIVKRLKPEDYSILIEELLKKKIKPLFKYDDYLGLKQKAKFECEIHGIFESKLDNLKYSTGCRKCATHHSDAQSEIAEFVLTLVSKIEENTRKYISPLEIDILDPISRVGIEYCGLWWHNELYKNPKEHKYKLDRAIEKDIRLITIFEDEWVERRHQIEGYLRSVFGKNDFSVYARKTEVKKINKEEVDIFLEKNHIQGSCIFSIAFGLYYKDELVGLITGGKHHRNNSIEELVLSRMAFKNNVTVVGGASKLLKVLVEYAKKRNYTKIISWSDNRWSEGNVYNKLGFELTKELKPDYSYVKKHFRVSKQSMTKTRLKKMGGTGSTEREMALSLGYRRIWDCGKKRWELKIIKKQ